MYKHIHLLHGFIEKDNHRLVKKLEREHIIFLFKNFPGLSARFLLRYFVETPCVFEKLTLEEWALIVLSYKLVYRSDQPIPAGRRPLSDLSAQEILAGCLANQVYIDLEASAMARWLLHYTHSLIPLLEQRDILVPLVCATDNRDNFLDQKVRHLKPNYDVYQNYQETDKTILDHLLMVMTADDWQRFYRRHFTNTDYTVSNERILNALSPTGLYDLVRWVLPKDFWILFSQPGQATVYFVPDKAIYFKSKGEQYKFNYIFVESDQELYYFYNERSALRVNLPPDEYPQYPAFNTECLVEQLSALKTEQNSSTHIELTSADVRRLIIENNGFRYPSSLVQRLTQATTNGKLAFQEIKSLWRYYQHKNEYDTPRDQAERSYRSVTVDLMRDSGWDPGRPPSWQKRSPIRPKESHILPIAPRTPIGDHFVVLSADEEKSMPTLSREPRRSLGAQNNSADSAKRPRCLLKHKLLITGGVSATALGTVGIALIKYGILTGLTQPYLWPVALALTAIGGLVLIGTSLQVTCRQRGLFTTEPHSEDEHAAATEALLGTSP